MRHSLNKRRKEDVPSLEDADDPEEVQRHELLQLERRRHEIAHKLKELENKEKNLEHAGTYPRKRPRPDQNQQDEEEREHPSKRRVTSSIVSQDRDKETEKEEEERPDKEREIKTEKEAEEGEDKHRDHKRDSRSKGDDRGRARSEREETDRRREDGDRDRSRKRGREDRDATEDKHDSKRDEISSKRRREDAPTEDVTLGKPKPAPVAPKEVQRTRKMFGVLLGTLQRFKKEEDTKSEKEQLREKITEQVKQKEQEEREKLLEAERERIAKEKEEALALQESLNKEIEEKEASFLNSKWDRHRKLIANPLFKKTKAEPCIYYTVNQSMKDVRLPTSPEVVMENDEDNEDNGKRNRNSDDEDEEEDEYEGRGNLTVQAVESTPAAAEKGAVKEEPKHNKGNEGTNEKPSEHGEEPQTEGEHKKEE